MLSIKNKFDNNLLIYSIYVVKNKYLLLDKYLLKGRVKKEFNKQYLYLYYDIKGDYNKIKYKSEFEENCINVFVQAENNDIYIIVKYKIPEIYNFDINVLYNQDLNILTNVHLIELIEYWKEYTHLILEHEKTRTARESSPGLFFYSASIILFL